VGRRKIFKMGGGGEWKNGGLLAWLEVEKALGLLSFVVSRCNRRGFSFLKREMSFALYF
jgi:hypothetical protein